MSKPYGSIPVIEGNEPPQSGAVYVATLRNKQGHSCCGGCCDMRRAVIIVNLVMISMLLFLLFAEATVSHVDFDDDEMQHDFSPGPSFIMVFVVLVEISLLGVATWGAVGFSAAKVMAGIIVYFIRFLMCWYPFNLASLLITGFFAYPHIFLYREIQSGIMSHDNYYNEEQSCCCV